MIYNLYEYDRISKNLVDEHPRIAIGNYANYIN